MLLVIWWVGVEETVGNVNGARFSIGSTRVDHLPVIFTIENVAKKVLVNTHRQRNWLCLGGTEISTIPNRFETSWVFWWQQRNMAPNMCYERYVLREICTMNNIYYEPGIGMVFTLNQTRSREKLCQNQWNNCLQFIHLSVWSTFYWFLYVSLCFIKRVRSTMALIIIYRRIVIYYTDKGPSLQPVCLDDW